MSMSTALFEHTLPRLATRQLCRAYNAIGDAYECSHSVYKNYLNTYFLGIASTCCCQCLHNDVYVKRDPILEKGVVVKDD